MRILNRKSKNLSSWQKKRIVQVSFALIQHFTLIEIEQESCNKNEEEKNGQDKLSDSVSDSEEISEEEKEESFTYEKLAPNNEIDIQSDSLDEFIALEKEVH